MRGGDGCHGAMGALAARQEEKPKGVQFQRLSSRGPIEGQNYVRSRVTFLVLLSGITTVTIFFPGLRAASLG